MPPSLNKTTTTSSWAMIPPSSDDDSGDENEERTPHNHDVVLKVGVVPFRRPAVTLRIPFTLPLSQTKFDHIRWQILQAYACPPLSSTAVVEDYSVTFFYDDDDHPGYQKFLMKAGQMQAYLKRQRDTGNHNNTSTSSTTPAPQEVSFDAQVKIKQYASRKSKNLSVVVLSMLPSMQTLLAIAVGIIYFGLAFSCIVQAMYPRPTLQQTLLTDSRFRQEFIKALVQQQHQTREHPWTPVDLPPQQLEQWTCAGAATSTKPRRCFTTHNELRQAVLDYSQNPADAHSLVAQTYGWPIGTWCVTHVTDFSRIFKYSTLNEPLQHWDVSNAETMERMFYGARKFNQDLHMWNTAKVRNLRQVFAGATAFDGDVSTWNTSQVVDMDGLFDQAISFNGNLSAWNVERVTNMHATFRGTVAFDGTNGSLRQWNTARVTNTARMFRGSGITGNAGLSQWTVSKVTRMDFMFEGATAFDEDLSEWDVSGVRTVKGMFLDAHAFSHDLCSWGQRLPHKADAARMFDYATACPAAQDGPLVLAGPVPSPICHRCER